MSLLRASFGICGVLALVDTLLAQNALVEYLAYLVALAAFGLAAWWPDPLPPPPAPRTSGSNPLAMATASYNTSTGECGAIPVNRPASRLPRASWTRGTTSEWARMLGPHTTMARLAPKRLQCRRWPR